MRPVATTADACRSQRRAYKTFAAWAPECVCLSASIHAVCVAGATWGHRWDLRSLLTLSGRKAPSDLFLWMKLRVNATICWQSAYDNGCQMAWIGVFMITNHLFNVRLWWWDVRPGPARSVVLGYNMLNESFHRQKFVLTFQMSENERCRSVWDVLKQQPDKNPETKSVYLFFPFCHFVVVMNTSVGWKSKEQMARCILHPTEEVLGGLCTVRKFWHCCRPARAAANVSERRAWICWERRRCGRRQDAAAGKKGLSKRAKSKRI